MLNAPRAADTVPELLRRRVGREPDAAALVDVDGTSLTIGDWYTQAATLASVLVADGLRPGERVCLVAESTHWLDFAVSYMATLMAGGVAVPCTASTYRALTADRPAFTATLTVVHGGDPVPNAEWPTVPFRDLATRPAAAVPLPVLSGDMPAEISCTAGTEGPPAPVLSCHETLCVTYRADLLTASAGGRYLLALPFGNSFAQTVFLDALQMPATQLHIAPKFEPVDFVDRLGRLDIDVTFMVPAMVEALMREPELAWRGVGKLVAICVSGAPVRRAALAFLADRVPGASVANSYCSTEAWPSGTEWEFRPDAPLSAGLPWEGREVKIIDADLGSPVGPSVTGVICLRSRGVRPRIRLTGPAPVDGWVRTDDLGFLDDHGQLHLVGRNNDVFTVGGIQLAPARLEAALLAHPAVRDVAVVVAPHPTLQAIPVALVVPLGPVTSRQLLSWCIEALGAEHAPKAIYQVKRIPRNDAGKVRRSSCDELLAQARRVAAALDDPGSVMTYLAEVWTGLLRTTTCPRPGTNFFEFGGDSVTATKLSRRLEQDYGVRVMPRLVLENPRLREFAAAVVESLRAEADQLAGPIDP